MGLVLSDVNKGRFLHKPVGPFYQFVCLDSNPIHSMQGVVVEPPHIHTLVLNLPEVGTSHHVVD